MNLLNIDDLSDEQIRRYLKEENIGKPHGSSISNMTLYPNHLFNTQN